jgi:hypothetical protein
MLNLYFKRAKIFLLNTGDKEERFQANITNNGPIAVPDWVKSTLTYKHGVADKSILDLTPPTRKKTAPAEEEAPGASYAAGVAAVGKNAADPIAATATAVLDEPKADKPAFGNEVKQKAPAGLGGNSRGK